MQDAFHSKNDYVKVLIGREYFHTEREYHIEQSNSFIFCIKVDFTEPAQQQQHDASLRTKRCLTKEAQNVQQQSKSVTNLLG